MATAAAGLILLSAGAASGASAARQDRVIRTAGSVTEFAPQPITLPLAAKPRLTSRPVTAHAHAAAAARRAAATRTQAKPVKRWLPTGTGMWLHDWTRSERGNPRAVVGKAKRHGLSTLYVQTGSSKKGWIGDPVLRALLPATKGTDIKVVAWDFPKLVNPVVDARRMARAATFRCAGCPRVAAVAPDIETRAEGTQITQAAIQRYYTVLRQLLPRDVAILATIPWPSEMRTGSYPYARTAAHADALLPMAYWYNRSPAVVTATSMRYLKRFGKPVMPVGQGYDGRIDAPYLAADPNPGLSVMAFLLTARHGGAKHVSLWSWQTTGKAQWASLSKGRRLFS